jgi:putative SOS response-associated peptidase YedK
MCGRFALNTNPKALADYFSATLTYDLELSYNIAPTRTIAGMIAVDGERLIVPLRWGLIPSWYKEGSKLPMLNNARGETVDTKPSFRHSFRHQRCLILTDGFYEWDAKQDPKQPYFIPMQHNKPYGMAGLWSRWISGRKAIESCCIITLEANPVIAAIHERMPAIIPSELIDSWLDGSLQDIAQLKQIIENPSASNLLAPYPVSRRINKANFDEAECIQAI